MDREVRKSEFRLPMIEIVIVVGIFAVLSVFLLRMFVTADRLSSDAENIGKAVVRAQAAAETVKGSPDPEEALKNLGLQKNGAASYSGHFDENWESIQDGGMFQMSVLLSVSDENVLSAKITVTDSRQEELCSLTVKRYGQPGAFAGFVSEEG